MQARFDTSLGRNDCAPSTRVELLTSVYRWIDQAYGSTDESPQHDVVDIPLDRYILWINGLAGTGKSTLAQTIARWCDRKQVLGASFFCSRSGQRSNVRLIFPTIAQQLAPSNEQFLNSVKDAVFKNSDIHFSHPSHQLEKLIVEPLRAIPTSGSIPARIVIIDALDECEDVEAVSVI